MTYPNAPITEAVIDIRLSPKKAVKLDDLKKLSKKQRDDFPMEVELHSMEAQFMVGSPEKTSNFKSEAIGFQGTSADGKRIYQFRRDGFVFSQQTRYVDWQQFRQPAKQLWDYYSGRIGNIDTVSRIAVRFINNVKVEGANIDLKEYFNLYPQIGDHLPRQKTGFLTTVAFVLDDGKATGTISLVPAVENNTAHTTFILDIDVSRVDLIPSNSADLWDIIDGFRNEKNQLFEGCITDKTRELFQ
jgi:uncharacterized protein (TIGR04255 family)